MKTLGDIKEVLAEHKEELKDEFKVKEIGVFGSYAKGSQRKQSDADILVEFYEPVGLFKFMELEAHLEKLLKIKVDLASKKALKPHIGEQILKEVVYA